MCIKKTTTCGQWSYLLYGVLLLTLIHNHTSLIMKQSIVLHVSVHNLPMSNRHVDLRVFENIQCLAALLLK